MKSFNKKTYKYIFTFLAVILSAILQTYSIQVFMEPSNLIASGFTGVALLLKSLFSLDTSIGLILLNVPIAIICYKRISPNFTIFSCIQFAATSLFLKIFHFNPMFNDIILNVLFGGFILGLSTVVALKGNASTGGVDFIALYFSNKYNKSVWEYIFIFNTILIVIFGFTNSWLYAGYSIIFQFITTKTISTFHTRYDRVTLLITTNKPEKLLEAYINEFKHGVTCLDGYGGYSKKPFTMLNTVVSSYEVKDVIDVLKEIDKDIIVNILKTENFIGGFYQKPMD